MSTPAQADRNLVTSNLLRPDEEIDYRIRADTERHRKGFVRIRVKDAEGRPVERAGIEIRQTGHAFKFGCNLFLLDQFDDAAHNAAYEEAFAALFNQAVLPFYWSDLEPAEGGLRFGVDSEPIYRRPPPDRCLEFCEARGISAKGHPLLWQLFYPQWLPADPARLRRLIEKRFREIAERYGDRIPTFDVCNEALALVGAHPLRDIGDHVGYAFELAQRYFPQGTTLVYNETTPNSFCGYRGPHSPMFMLCERLASQYRLGAVGLQFHLFERKVEMVEKYREDLLNPPNLFRCMDLYAKLGLPLKLSEVTVPAFALVDEGEQFQAEVAEKLYRIWFSHPSVDEIDYWNLVDGTAAWSPRNTSEGENFFKGGLVNYDISHKPVYTALDRLINHEWRTSVSLAYEDGGDNCLHGYYGTYEAVIRHAGGAERVPFQLLKGTGREVTLDLTTTQATTENRQAP